MTYKEFIERALGGRSVNKAALDMGISQTLLNKYKLGLNLPGFMNALILAKAARISRDEVLCMLAREEATRKRPIRSGKAGFAQ
ncbi:hypothetical protein [Cupriavidus sp. D39]|uniref:hypothetical protein n=1 Tax=Cupriavidus sp. D39 TaxID=2997877 RepID=UPI00226F8422|nr:hypothetical protein [Cupriavidus sp. D39]MCY0853342.1 hypothetical protein [Cupriavidus sp. D39]